MTTCGWELELSNGRNEALWGLRELGLTGHTNYHAYHCGCNDCQPRPFFGPDQKWFKAQNDCTAAGELISGVFEFGSDEMEQAILGQGHVLLTGRNIETQGNVGNHVHVGRNQLSPSGAIRLQRLFGRYGPDIQEIAAGPRPDMRGYNGTLRTPGEHWNGWTAESDTTVMSWGGMLAHEVGGHCLAFKPHTVEFRLWNSVRSPWRIRTHVGLSVAFMDAAIAGQDAEYNDPRPLEDVIGDFMDATTWAGVIRQRFSKGGISGT